MNKYDSILIEKKDQIGYVFFNNPILKNRIGRKEGLEMIAALQEVDQDPEIKVIILAGKGGYFCSGGKIDGFPDGLIVDQRNYADTIINTVKAIHNLHKPIIAAVENDAFAAGLMYLDACDLAVIGENSKFGLPEIKRGYFPMIALVALRFSIPKKQLLEMSYTGREIDAKTMHLWNLVNYVVPNDKVLSKAKSIALDLIELNPMSLRYGRDCYYNTLNMNVDDSMKYAGSAIINMINTQDAKETAYAEKEGRPAKYLGF